MSDTLKNVNKSTLEWYSELNKSTLLNQKHFIILPIYGYKDEKTNEFIMDIKSMKEEFEMKIKNAKEALNGNKKFNSI